MTNEEYSIIPVIFRYRKDKWYDISFKISILCLFPVFFLLTDLFFLKVKMLTVDGIHFLSCAIFINSLSCTYSYVKIERFEGSKIKLQILGVYISVLVYISFIGMTYSMNSILSKWFILKTAFAIIAPLTFHLFNRKANTITVTSVILSLILFYIQLTEYFQIDNIFFDLFNIFSNLLTLFLH